MTAMNRDTTIFVCRHILDRQRDVALVVHHGDDQWQFLCGGYDHPTDYADIHPVHFHHVVERQPELQAVAEATPKGYLSEKSGAGWEAVAHDD